MACLLCTHDTSNERETNQQETNDQNAKMSCLQWKHKQFIQEIARNLFRFLIRKAMFQKVTKWQVCYAHQKVTKWHVCYAHMIHQTNVKQTNKKQTIYTQASLFWVSMFDTPHSILLCTTQTKTSEAN